MVFTYSLSLNSFDQVFSNTLIYKAEEGKYDSNISVALFCYIFMTMMFDDVSYYSLINLDLFSSIPTKTETTRTAIQAAQFYYIFNAGSLNANSLAGLFRHRWANL